MSQSDQKCADRDRYQLAASRTVKVTYQARPNRRADRELGEELDEDGVRISYHAEASVSNNDARRFNATPHSRITSSHSSSSSSCLGLALNQSLFRLGSYIQCPSPLLLAIEHQKEGSGFRGCGVKDSELCGLPGPGRLYRADSICATGNIETPTLRLCRRIRHFFLPSSVEMTPPYPSSP